MRVRTFQSFLLISLALAVLPVSTAQAQRTAEATYRAGFRATCDVLQVPLSIKQLTFACEEPLDFLNPEGLAAALESVTVFDGSREGVRFDASALPDTVSDARPYLTVHSLTVARALTASQPCHLTRVFSPPFDRTKDFSISYLVGFSSEPARDAFVEAVRSASGVVWVYKDRALPDGMDDI